MARLHITCYRHMAVDDFGRLIAAPMTPPIEEMFVQIGVKSAASDPFPKYTTFIEVMADTTCALAFGKEPVADPDYHVIHAGAVKFYGVTVDDRIAVIEASNDDGQF